MKSKTGYMMSIVLGVTQYRYSKQNLNTNISTKLEPVGAGDYVPYNIWYFMFMHQYGYLKKSNKFSIKTKAT